MSIEKAYRTFY